MPTSSSICCSNLEGTSTGLLVELASDMVGSTLFTKVLLFFHLFFLDIAFANDWLSTT